MAKCDYCGKKARMGRTSKHRRGVASRKFQHQAPKKAKKFRANIQKVTVRVGGLKLKMKLCTHCIKTMRKKEKEEKEKKEKRKTAVKKTAPKTIKKKKSRQRKTEKK